MIVLNDIIRECTEKEATDLHLKVGKPPVLRVNNELVYTSFPPVTSEEMRGFLVQITTPEQLQQFESAKELDFGFTFPNLGRFRINVYLQRGEIGIAMRRLRTRIPSFSELELPETLADICNFESGLVLVAGPTSSGKSTTIASMIDYINQNRQVHIITIEDPIVNISLRTGNRLSTNARWV